MNAVSGDGPRPQDAQGVQPVDSANASTAEAIFHIGLILCHVDVAAYAQVTGNPHRFFYRFVG